MAALCGPRRHWQAGYNNISLNTGWSWSNGVFASKAAVTVFGNGVSLNVAGSATLSPGSNLVEFKLRTNGGSKAVSGDFYFTTIGAKR